MEINENFIKSSSLIASGTTSYIMQHQSGFVYKLYKIAIDYILKESEYQLDLKDTLNRLNYIISKNSEVKLTDLPNDILTYNGKPVGVSINYYKDSMTLNEFLNSNFNVNYAEIKNEIMKIVGELIENGIVPTDPHFDNFLVSFSNDGKYKLKMIDIDDIYVSVYPEHLRDVWYESEVSSCYRVIDLSFKKLINNNLGSKTK